MEGNQGRTSYDASLKYKVFLYAEKNGNRKAEREFNVSESNIWLRRKQKLTLFGTKANRKKFTGPRNNDADEVLTPEQQCGQLTLNEVFLYIVGCPDIQEKLANSSEEESVWSYVSSEMSRFGYPMGEHAAEKCQQMWNQMVSGYNTFQNTKKWNDEPDCPSFFEMLEQILKPNVQIEDQRNVVEVISVADNNESLVAEPRSKKLKLEADYNIDTLSSSGSQCSDGNELLETPEVEESDNAYIDSVTEGECVYYDEHITVYPETTNSELTEEIVLTDMVVDSGNSQNVYVVVTPSIFDHSVFMKFGDENSEAELANEIKYAYLPVVESSNGNQTIQYEGEEVEEVEGEEGEEGEEEEEDEDEEEEMNLVEQSNRTRMAVRPVPTPAQALMALVTRIGREETERDNWRRIKMEKRFNALENTILKQNSKIRELTERATALLTDLLQDSSDSD